MSGYFLSYCSYFDTEFITSLSLEIFLNQPSVDAGDFVVGSGVHESIGTQVKCGVL